MQQPYVHNNVKSVHKKNFLESLQNYLPLQSAKPTALKSELYKIGTNTLKRISFVQRTFAYVEHVHNVFKYVYIKAPKAPYKTKTLFPAP